MDNIERNEDDKMAEFFGITETERARPSVLSATERRAFQAAWRIDREPVPETLNKLACQSTRHARYIEHMARIIQDEMGR